MLPTPGFPSEDLGASAKVRFTVEARCGAKPATPLAVACLGPPAERLDRAGQTFVRHRIYQLMRLLAYGRTPV